MAESNVPDFDPAKYRLGKLCLNAHEWGESRQSLRRVSNNACLECARHRTREWRSRPEIKEILFWQRRTEEERRKSNERLRKSRAGRGKELYQRRKAYYKIYYQRNKERIRARHDGYSKSYYQRPSVQERRRLHCTIRRFRKRAACLEPYTPSDVQALRDLFGGCCAYCNKPGSPAIDHFKPLSKGGLDAIDNLLPCCTSCNSSKGNRHPERWYKAQPFYSDRRWQRILEILGLS